MKLKIEDFRIMETDGQFFIQRNFKKIDTNYRWWFFRGKRPDIDDWMNVDKRGDSHFCWLRFRQLENIMPPKFLKKEDAVSFIEDIIERSKITYHYPPFK